MLIVPPELYFSIYLTFAFHHNKSEQSKWGENSEPNLKYFFELFDLALLHVRLSYITLHYKEHKSPFFPFYSLEIQKEDNPS